MKKVLGEIQDGTFASEFIQEFNAGGKAKFLASRAKEASHPLCKVGKELRDHDELAEEISRYNRIYEVRL